MIQIPIYDLAGKQTGALDVDEALLGGEIRPALLKQAYVRSHANRRQGSAASRTRAQVHGSGKKMYKQKGTGNARAGDKRSNIRRGGGHAFAKAPRSFRQGMPDKMRQLANRNALLAKAVDQEIKLIDGLSFDKPSTKQFNTLLSALEINRTCLVAMKDTRDPAGVSARNIDDVDLTRVDQLNVFDVLNHRFLIADKGAFETYLAVAAEKLANKSGGQS